MLQFIIGLIVGGIFGFGVCAICSMAGTDDRIETPKVKETGDSDAPSK